MKIAIIGGAGKMGRWLCRFLQQENHEIILADKDQEALANLQDEYNAAVASSQEAVKMADAVIISVNIDSFEEAVREIAPAVLPDQIVVDVTSIKETPVEVMHRYLPQAQILGTHPLFGPGAKSLAGQNFVLTPTTEKEKMLAEKVFKFLQTHGARVTVMSPQKHDEMMSVVLGLSHFISIVAADTLMDIGKLPELKAVGGTTYRVLTTLVESVVSEDPELYATLQMRLPYVQEMEQLFQMHAQKWAEMVQKQDRAGFIRSMTNLKYRYASANTNFGQAYDNMYRVIEWL
ncbi:MAG TPA: prephenate dehydrogenase [Dehalococcoidales bacterium]|nr:prephenate dehydrogenase [Dehalococcoidales bacterium]